MYILWKHGLPAPKLFIARRPFLRAQTAFSASVEIVNCEAQINIFIIFVRVYQWKKFQHRFVKYFLNWCESVNKQRKTETPQLPNWEL